MSEDRRDPDWMKGVADNLRFPPERVVRLRFDAGGSGYVWSVIADNVLIWHHAAIEGPPGDGLHLWKALYLYNVGTLEIAPGSEVEFERWCHS